MQTKILAGIGVVAMIAAAAPAKAMSRFEPAMAGQAFQLAQAEGQAETEEQIRLRQEAEAAAKAAEEAARQQAEQAQREAEEATRRQAEEAQRQAEEAARAAEEEARRQAEQAQREAEEAARQQAEEVKRQAEEAERAAAEASRKQQEEQQRQAEDAQRQADEAARAAAEEEERKRREAQAAQPAPEAPAGQADAPAAQSVPEERRRERERDRRDETIGAALTGAVIGALVPQLGGVIAADEGDRIIVERDGRYFVRKDDSALFRDRADDIRYERLRGGLVREIVTRPNGSQIITVRDAGGNLLRRERITRNGDVIVLFDTRDAEIRRPYGPVVVPSYTIEIPRENYIVSARRADRALVYETLAAEPVYTPPQRYALRDIRENAEVRQLVRRVDLDTVTFESGSSYVSETQIRLLGDIAGGMLDVIENDPSAVFLIEGHTDAVGTDLSNLALSDRRAETVARILSEAYDIPPENLVVQGYGEQFLKVQTEADERANRRVTVRNISPILQGAANQ